MLGPRKFSSFDVLVLVFGAMLMQRWLAVWCAKGAAFYAARGDQRQAARFEWMARHFARMSTMYGELDPLAASTPGPLKKDV